MPQSLLASITGAQPTWEPSAVLASSLHHLCPSQLPHSMINLLTKPGCRPPLSFPYEVTSQSASSFGPFIPFFLIFIPFLLFSASSGRRIRCGWAQHKHDDPPPLDYNTVDHADPANSNVYVGSLSADVSELELKRQFGAFGPINEVKCYTKGERCATTAGLSTVSGGTRRVDMM